MENKKLVILILFILQCNFASAQLIDTISLNEVTVKAYLKERPLFRIPSAVSLLSKIQIDRQEKNSLVSVINTVPGVRMEERSPGSYRLSLRGSLLRSPFGIRNVKIYLDEFPLTDAGGNTYLNLLDINIIDRVEILKGPDGSLFGANSGGVVRISTTNNLSDSLKIITGINYGSYNLMQQYIKAIVPLTKKNVLSIAEASQNYDGYRTNSGLKKQYFQIADNWKYAANSELSVFSFYSSLNYKTPGGLTLSQWDNNPRNSRPATATLPSAEEQQAGIINKTIYAGILNNLKINNTFKQVTAIFVSVTDLKNPFITNYETRKENNAGIRTWLEAANNKEGLVNLVFNAGWEGQQGISFISNNENNNGTKDSLQEKDKLKSLQNFFFARLVADVHNRLTIEISSSINNNSFIYSGIYPVNTSENKRSFSPQLMPRLAASCLISNNLLWRASVSRGYSPPAIAEIRSSTNTINTSLQAESGWNYETGFRLHDKYLIASWDVSIFYYKLQNAIVQKRNDDGEEYFVNAGGTSQPGIESQIILHPVSNKLHGIIRKMEIINSCTFNKFIFSNYINDDKNFSNNKITGVPEEVVVTNIYVQFPEEWFIFIQHNYTSALPLNDANLEFAHPYNIFQVKAGWNYILRKYKLNLAAGIENLTDQRYSLGNDLNAAGGRYYNAAEGRNYFASITFSYN